MAWGSAKWGKGGWGAGQFSGAFGQKGRGPVKQGNAPGPRTPEGPAGGITTQAPQPYFEKRTPKPPPPGMFSDALGGDESRLRINPLEGGVESKSGKPGTGHIPSYPDPSLDFEMTHSYLQGGDMEKKIAGIGDRVTSRYESELDRERRANAQAAFDRIYGMTPQNLSGIYDEAFNRKARQINNQMSSQGLLGSSAAAFELNSAALDFAQKEAEANAAYQLKYGDMLSGAGVGADASNLGYDKRLDDLAGEADQGYADQTGAYADYYVTLDNQAFERGNEAFDRSMQLAEAESGILEDTGGDIGSSYSDATLAQIEQILGISSDVLADLNRKAEEGDREAQQQLEFLSQLALASFKAKTGGGK